MSRPPGYVPTSGGGFHAEGGSLRALAASLADKWERSSLSELPESAVRGRVTITDPTGDHPKGYILISTIQQGEEAILASLRRRGWDERLPPGMVYIAHAQHLSVGSP